MSLASFLLIVGGFATIPLTVSKTRGYTLVDASRPNHLDGLKLPSKGNNNNIVYCLMNEENIAATWEQIVEILHEKLQYGLLEQLKSVTDIAISAHDLTLSVTTSEAVDYFNAEINQQRLIILARPVVNLESVAVVKVEAE